MGVTEWREKDGRGTLITPRASEAATTILISPLSLSLPLAHRRGAIKIGSYSLMLFFFPHTVSLNDSVGVVFFL